MVLLFGIYKFRVRARGLADCSQSPMSCILEDVVVVFVGGFLLILCYVGLGDRVNRNRFAGAERRFGNG